MHFTTRSRSPTQRNFVAPTGRSIRADFALLQPIALRVASAVRTTCDGRGFPVQHRSGGPATDRPRKRTFRGISDSPQREPERSPHRSAVPSRPGGTSRAGTARRLPKSTVRPPRAPSMRYGTPSASCSTPSLPQNAPTTSETADMVRQYGTCSNGRECGIGRPPLRVLARSDALLAFQ